MWFQVTPEVPALFKDGLYDCERGEVFYYQQLVDFFCLHMGKKKSLTLFKVFKYFSLILFFFLFTVNNLLGFYCIYVSIFKTMIQELLRMGELRRAREKEDEFSGALLFYTFHKSPFTLTSS